VNSTLAISARPQPDMLSNETLRPLHVARGPHATGWMVRTLVSTALLMLCAMPAMNAQNIISTVAGGGTIPSTPLTADIPGPTATIKDSAGNLYIAAPFSANIFKLSGGVLTLWAGQGWGGFNADNIQVSAAVLGKPAAFAFDTHGNLYFADLGNTRIRKVNMATQKITTVAGNGKKCASSTASCGDGGPAKHALLNLPQGIAVDGAGNIFIADSSDNRIRRVDHASPFTITTFAGTGKPCPDPTTSCGDEGAANSAKLNFPEGVAVDAAGNVYIADTKDHRIRYVDLNGKIHAFAGNGGACLDSTQQCGDGKAATGANLRLPQAVAVDASGNFYIADAGDHRIRFVDSSTKIISTVVGNGTQGFSGDGGSATAAELDLPGGIYLDSTGNIIISDTGNQRIRQVDTTGTITTLAGGGLGDSTIATNAILAGPYNVFEDASGNIYFADQANNRIRLFTKGGGVSTVAGTGSAGYSGDGGQAKLATLNGPSSVVLDKSGNMYIADTNNLRVRKVDTTGKITTFAGNGSSCTPSTSSCGDTGPATSANLSFPTYAAFDSAGNLYIADYFAHKVRKVDTGSTITTVAGTGKAGYSGDGGLGTQAQLNHPSSVGADSAGNLYIADQYNNRIRGLNLQTDIISTYALNGNTCLCGDGGPAIDGSMWNPLEVSVDPSANVFVSGGNAKVVQRIDAVTGTWGTVAGIASQPGIGGFSGDGGPATKARLASNGTSVDAQNNLYIADYGNNRIRFVHLTPDVTVPTTPLTFGNWPLNTTSTPLTVQLTSTGGVDLSLTGITISGTNASDFAETASCGNPPPAIPLGVDSTCTISVTFTPSDYARRTATLTFTDNGPTSPQTVSLAGSGPDFTISASPTTITVAKGSSGTSTLTLTPLGQFNQLINLTCAVSPAIPTCTVPDSVQMDGTNSKTAMLTVQTTSTTPSGTYTVTAKGFFVPLQHPVTVTVIVP
jgi:trimeric autotransporter adhesin